MYLRRQNHEGTEAFYLCESYRKGDCWKHRVLVELGADPEVHVEYGGGNSFYVRQSLEEELRSLNAEYSYRELEALFIPFIDPAIRRIVERFQSVSEPRSRYSRLSPEALLNRQRAVHSFDKRRLHYLRCGRVHIGDLDGKPWKFFNVLLDKSRDEIESLLGDMERELQPSEIRRYLYTAFGLECHFRHLPTRHQPEALDPFQVEEFFLRDLCLLNRDERFFSGVDEHDPEALHPYLRKYAVLCFDSPFDPRMIWDEDVSDFTRRPAFTGRAGAPSGTLSGKEKEACRSLGLSPPDFKGMDREALIRAYRRLAMKSHPDKGGDKETFVRVKAAYECLLKLKG